MSHDRICDQCNQPFQVDYNSSPLRFCCRSCWREYVATHESPKKTKLVLSCPTCGKSFEAKPCQVKAVKTRLCCCRDCGTAYKRRRRQEQIEQEFGKPIFALLYDLYCIQGLGIKQVARRLKVSDRNLWDWFNDLGIQRRERSHAVRLQWLENDTRRQEQSERAKRHFADGTLDPTRIVKIARTQDARRRNSESRQGKKNWMHGRRGPLHHMWNGGKVYYYGASWPERRNEARERDRYTCRRCGVTESQIGKQLDVHHIVKFRVFGLSRHKEANALSNLVSLCTSCHAIIEPRPWKELAQSSNGTKCEKAGSPKQDVLFAMEP